MAITGCNNVSADVLANYAETMMDETIRDDLKDQRTRRSQKMKNQVTSAKDAIKNNEKAADERLKSAKKKTGGGLWGSICGVALAVTAIVVVCLVPMAAPLAAAVIGLGAACLGTGNAVGSAIGNKRSEGNDKAADEFKIKADESTLEDKEFDKQAADLQDMIQQSKEQLRQIQQSRTKRDQNLNRPVVA